MEDQNICDLQIRPFNDTVDYIDVLPVQTICSSSGHSRKRIKKYGCVSGCSADFPAFIFYIGVSANEMSYEKDIFIHPLFVNGFSDDVNRPRKVRDRYR